MATTKTVIENVELSPNGEISIYITNGKGSLGVESREISFNIWLTLEELKQVADTINKALEQ